MIHISGKTYEVVVDHKNGWRFEAFRDRYSEVLERYDYIVGDWGYSQLRLRGFFKDNHPKATKDSMISTLQDYLNEYCNFGCAYFIIEKVPNKSGVEPTGAPGDFYEDKPAAEAGAETEQGAQPAVTAEASVHRHEDTAAVAAPRTPSPQHQRYNPSGKTYGPRHGQGQQSGGQNQSKSQHGSARQGEGRSGGRHQGQGQNRQQGHASKPKSGQPSQNPPKPKPESSRVEA
ncbi:YutD family protein [Paenibacillus sp. MZ04-78.2]|uniref:YutD family protein n=1 Tax=Paenibacillus sp. MZ04-78.2 TaxID=2962034 RepID=UPI0020B6AE8F|nr:YutD family protein [Paenibacillus sp. MZ04-78.2]MCP3773824.1 YutD family protein [Paenibacillus sp. MZ04-78.2]